MTATLCLLAFGAVMVYSASSPLGRAQRPGQRHRRVRPLPDVRRRSGWSPCTCSRAAGWRCSTAALVDAAAGRLVRAAAAGAGPGVRRRGQRRPALVRRGPDPVPALGADEARAGPLRGAVPGRPPEADARASARRSRRSRSSPRRRCLLIVVEPDLGTALVIAFTIAALLIAAGMPPRYLALLAAIAVGVVLLLVARPALPARAADLVPAPLVVEVRRRLPGRPGPDRAGLGRPVRGRARPLGAEDLLPARGPDRLHPRGDRRGARRARDLRRGRSSTG